MLFPCKNGEQSRQSVSGGFTLIEMIVVIAIFGIVTTIIIANLPVFRDRSSLDLVTQEVAINIRGAQVFGGSGRLDIENSNNTGRPTYGIHFSESNNQFLLYRDRASGSQSQSNYYYDGTSEKVLTYTLSNGFIIKDVCYDDTCPSSLDLSFTRPNLEPKIFDDGTLVDTEKVHVIIQSARSGECRIAEVWRNGQVAVVGLTDDDPSIGGCTNQPSQS